MGYASKITAAAICAGISVSAAGCDNSASQLASLSDAERLALLEAQTQTASGFATPRSDGSFEGSIGPVFSGQFADAQGNGYAYEVRKNDTDFSAAAGILPGTQVGALPLSGMAAMSGVYQVAEIGNSDGAGRDYGEVVRHSGRITLRADFNFGTLQGSSDELIVDGTFAGSALSGTVFFMDRQGQLTGLIGSDRAVGAFHGSDSQSVMSGGFLVE